MKKIYICLFSLFFAGKNFAQKSENYFFKGNLDLNLGSKSMNGFDLSGKGVYGYIFYRSELEQKFHKADMFGGKFLLSLGPGFIAKSHAMDIALGGGPMVIILPKYNSVSSSTFWGGNLYGYITKGGSFESDASLAYSAKPKDFSGDSSLSISKAEFEGIKSLRHGFGLGLKYIFEWIHIGSNHINESVDHSTSTVNPFLSYEWRGFIFKAGPLLSRQITRTTVWRAEDNIGFSAGVIYEFFVNTK